MKEMAEHIPQDGMEIYDGTGDLLAMPTNHTAHVVSCGQIVARRNGLTLRKSGRRDFSLFYCHRGTVHFAEGELLAGGCFLYPAHAPQKYAVLAEEGTVYRYLHFTGADIGELIASLEIPVCVPIPSPQGGCEELLAKIAAAVAEGTARGDVVAEYTVLRLLTLLSPPKGKAEMPLARATRRVLEEMAHGYHLPYEPEKYARIMGMSRSRFDHVFRERVGVSPMRYFTDLRMENACRLLLHTDMKVAQVAQNVGYDDPLYFGRLFKERMGVSPSRFRRRGENGSE